MITCIALDDEPLALEIISTFSSKLNFLDLQKTFTNSSEANKFLHKFPVDLIFLDINMPQISGIDFYKSISQDTLVIFTTAHSEYAVDGFNVNALDYLLKPIEYKRFVKAAEKAKEYYHFKHQTPLKNDQFLYVRSEYSLVKIQLDDILFIESLDDYLTFHLLNNKSIKTIMTIKNLMEKLPQKDFVRVHRSFVLALKRIESVRAKQIDIGTIQIPIGTKYELEFFKRYTSENFF